MKGWNLIQLISNICHISFIISQAHKIAPWMFLCVFNWFCGADFIENVVHFYPFHFIFVFWKYCISGKIRAVMKLCSGDTHGLVPYRLWNWVSLPEFHNENKRTIFGVCKIFSFCFDLMIHSILQNQIFLCGLTLFNMWQQIQFANRKKMTSEIHYKVY